MGTRREARERAVQFLFQLDVNPPEDLEAAMNAFWDSRQGSPESDDEPTPRKPAADPVPPSADELAVRLFADPLIKGTIEHRAEVDALIQKHAKNWDIRRMATVDRNILRLAIYEMLHREDIPPVVSINEAIEVAKKFSTEDSGKFVNGILDKVREELPRSARGDAAAP
jgi:N utilization substance protein B